MQKPLFQKDLAEIQHIGVYLSPQGLVQNAEPFFPAQRHIGQKPQVIGLSLEAAVQHVQLLQHVPGQRFLRAQGVQAFAVLSALLQSHAGHPRS